MSINLIDPLDLLPEDPATDSVANPIINVPLFPPLSLMSGLFVGVVWFTSFILKQNGIAIILSVIFFIIALLKLYQLYVPFINSLNKVSEGIDGVKSDVKKLNIKVSGHHKNNYYVLLDTNILYDSRIPDLITDPLFKNRFCIPRFILEELLVKTKSSDVLVANRAVQAIESVYSVIEKNDINVIDIPRDGNLEADFQLLDLAKKMGAVIFTNDNHIRSKATQQNVETSSMFELSESLEEPYGVNELFVISIVKKGRNSGDGVGFFRDGSMVVVENADHLIGQSVMVKIKSMLKHVNGRMFFGCIND